MARRSTTHRRIINDKADYITGKGFTCDEAAQPRLAAFVRQANGCGESLRQVLNKLAFDKALFGNAFLEAVTDPAHSFLALFHQDATRCRLARDSAHILLHHDWSAFRPEEARSLPLYPAFEEQADGTLRTAIHYKDYEPAFEHYGVPPYIAGLNVSAIAYKTDRWNISRLDNSFQLSGVMMLDSSADSEAEAERIVRLAEQKFAGNPGQVMFVLRDGGEAVTNGRFAFLVWCASIPRYANLLSQHKDRLTVKEAVEFIHLDFRAMQEKRGVGLGERVALATVLLGWFNEEMSNPTEEVQEVLFHCLTDLLGDPKEKEAKANWARLPEELRAFFNHLALGRSLNELFDLRMNS